MDPAIWSTAEILEPKFVRESLKEQLNEWTQMYK